MGTDFEGGGRPRKSAAGRERVLVAVFESATIVEKLRCGTNDDELYRSGGDGGES